MMGWLQQPKKPLRLGFILVPAYPERQRAWPDDPGCLLPLRGLRLSAQRHLSPPFGRPRPPVRPALAVQGLPGQCLAPTARRDLQAATIDLPAPGDRPVRALCQFPGPVLLGLWEAVMQGHVRLQPEVRKLL